MAEDAPIKVPALAPATGGAPAISPAAAYLASLDAGAARKSMVSTLRLIAADLGFPDPTECPWHELRHAHVAALRSLWAARMAPATANKRLTALRQVARHAWLAGAMAPDDCERIRAVPNVRGSRLPAGRALDAHELAALFRACSEAGDPAGRRDAAAFALLYGAGLRVSEACAVDADDYDRAKGAVRIIGKGNKERTVFCHGGGAAALEAWLAVRGGVPGPLLCHVWKSATIRHSDRMTPQAVAKRLTIRCGQAEITPCSPHDLRRSFVSAALDGGADIALVQRLAGHASPTTTARYDRRPDEAASDAARLVHVPFPDEDL